MPDDTAKTADAVARGVARGADIPTAEATTGATGKPTPMSTTLEPGTAESTAAESTAVQRPEAEAGTGLRTPPERALTHERRAAADGEARMRIGEVADRLGLSLRSIRHYEECGLVTPTARTHGGFRLYAEPDVQRLLLIMQMKPLGFALDEMGRVLDDLDAVAGTAGPADRAAAHERLVAVRADVEQRWASLRQRLEIAGMFREHLDEELRHPIAPDTSGDASDVPGDASGASDTD